MCAGTKSVYFQHRKTLRNCCTHIYIYITYYKCIMLKKKTYFRQTTVRQATFCFYQRNKIKVESLNARHLKEHWTNVLICRSLAGINPPIASKNYQQKFDFVVNMFIKLAIDGELKVETKKFAHVYLPPSLKSPPKYTGKACCSTKDSEICTYIHICMKWIFKMDIFTGTLVHLYIFHWVPCSFYGF